MGRAGAVARLAGSKRTQLVAASFLAVSLPGLPASAAEFPDVVEEILSSQTEGPMSELQGQKKVRMIECVNRVLVDLPKGRKRYVLEGSDYDEREKRFGKVMFENHAEWQQRLARGCADTSLSKDEEG